MVRGYDKTAAERVGFGQVEPNHLSAQKTGQIYAQLPAKDSNGRAIALIEQGQFLRYNYAQERASVDGDGEPMLVYVEEKLYDERKQHHKDFALKASDFTDGVIYPRLLKINVGDIYTTNTFGGNNTSDTAKKVFGFTPEKGTKLTVGENGFLTTEGAATADIVFNVVKVYTMPDGQMGVKVQRIK